MTHNQTKKNQLALFHAKIEGCFILPRVPHCPTSPYFDDFSNIQAICSGKRPPQNHTSRRTKVVRIDLRQLFRTIQKANSQKI
jgi:hypothetical protein